MTLLQSGILGVVEGVTEFLPISSTAHLLLATRYLGIEETEFVKTFIIIIQLGAILSVLALYFKKFWLKWDMLFKLAAALIPSVVVGLAFYKVIKNIFFENFVLMSGALIVGGLALVWLEKIFQPKSDSVLKVEDLSYKQCLIMGCYQALAVVPGVSRSGATIFGGLISRLPRATVVEFSFLLAVPTMAAASALDILKAQFYFGGEEYLMLGTGFLVSFVTAAVVIKWFLKFIQKHNFLPFAAYRIGLGTAILLVLFLSK